MRIDRSHTPWVIFVLAATAGATLLFVANFYPQKLPFGFHLPGIFGETPPLRHTFGGTPLGLIFGTVSYLIFLFASALGVRKKKRLWTIGRVKFWLKAHIWLTILTIPLVLYHCGFHMGGFLSSWLMVLYTFVMGSGFFGLALQQFMPVLMKETLTREVVFEQIAHIKERNFEAALELRHEVRDAVKAATVQPALAGAVAHSDAHGPVEPVTPAAFVQDSSLEIIGDFLDQECLPYLRGGRAERKRLSKAKSAADVFRLLKLNVSAAWEPKVLAMQSWCEDRRQMDLQVKFQHWLHGWLLIHVPTSFALLIITAWHAWVAVRYLITLPQ